MPVIQRVPRELLVVESTANLTTTSTAADGAAFSPAWGGNFDVASITAIEIEIYVPSVVHTTADWAGVVCYLDSVNQGVCYYWTWFAGVPLGGQIGRWRATLAAGSHSIAARGKLGAAGTGTFAMTATAKGLITVREVG